MFPFSSEDSQVEGHKCKHFDLFNLSLWIEQLRQTDASAMWYYNVNLLYISVLDQPSREVRLTVQATLSEKRMCCTTV